MANTTLTQTGAQVQAILDKADKLPSSLGTAGQVLTMNAGATAPEWQTPSGGGGTQLYQHKILTNTSIYEKEFYIISTRSTPYTISDLFNGHLYSENGVIGIYVNGGGLADESVICRVPCLLMTDVDTAGCQLIPLCGGKWYDDGTLRNTYEYGIILGNPYSDVFRFTSVTSDTITAL